MNVLEEVARSHEHLWNGVAVTPQGRLFASLPAWLAPSPGVMEVLPDGRLLPFPGNAWNAWAPGRDPTRAFVDVNSIHADGRGSLWVLDAAAPRFGDAIEGAVKLVQLDIASGKVRRVIVFDARDAHAGTRLAHMRLHGDHAFVVESKEASMNVIDLQGGRYRRVLVGHALMRCAPQDVPVVEGTRMQLRGEPMYFQTVACISSIRRSIASPCSPAAPTAWRGPGGCIAGGWRRSHLPRKYLRPTQTIGHRHPALKN